MAKKERPLRTKKRRNKDGPNKGGLSLNTISLLAFILFSAVFVIVVHAIRLSTQNIIDQQSKAIVQSQAAEIASRISNAVAPYTEGVRAIAMDPATRKLIYAQNPVALVKRQAELIKIFPQALSLRFIKAGVYQPTQRTRPYIGYACIDMFNSAMQRKLPPGIEVHVFGTPQQHVDIVHPVIDNNKVIGIVQLTIATKIIDSWLKQAVKDEYIELHQRAGKQKSLLIGKAGNSSDRKGDAIHYLDIEGTNWAVDFWPASRINTWYDILVTYGLLAIGVTLSALIVFLLRRSLSRAITEDIENLVQLVISTVRGDSKHKYTMQMPEFTLAAKHLGNFLQNVTPDRERDSDSNAVNVVRQDVDLNADPMFMGNNSMSVEIIDDGAPATEPESPDTSTSSQDSAPPLPPAVIFKAYDIRGIVGKTLNPAYAELIGKALGSEAVQRGLSKIAFARDGRLSGPELGQALVKGLMSTGINVIDVGMVATPVLYFAAVHLADNSGVMLTGSHNPPDYNGFKMVLGGETLAEDAIQQLRKRIELGDFASGSGKYSTLPMVDKYIQRITSDVKVTRPLKIVIDCGNGVAGGVAPKLYQALGCEVIELYCEVDGNFPNHHPDPSQPKNLQDVIEAVKNHKADLGMAFDGDGDRIGVISSDGKIIWPDRLLMLFAGDILSRNQGAQIIYDIKCSSNLTKVIWEKGGEPLMWKTGHSLIKSKMKQSGALLAGEMSGHIFFKERWYGFDDALYSGARLLEILSNDVRQPRVVFASLPDSVNTPELQIKMEEGEHHAFIDKLLDQADFGDANVTMIDGIRADYEDGWGLVRASNTTPCLVLRFEGQTQEAMQRVQDRFRKAMLAVDKSLKLPF